MDLISLAAAKNYTNKVAAGITAARVEGNSIILTLVDGTEAKCSLPVPKDGISVVDLNIDNDGSLLCHMSDGSIIDAGYVPMADVKLEDYYTKEEMDIKMQENASPKIFELTLPISLSSVSSSSTYITDANIVNSVNKLFTEAAAKGGDTCLLLVHFKSGTKMDSILFESNDMYYYTATRWGGHCNFSSYYMGNESFESPQQIVIYLGLGTWDANTGAHTGVRISIQRNLQWALAQERNVLTKTNTTSYTPTLDYHPATKKYVDSSISKAITDALTSAY